MADFNINGTLGLDPIDPINDSSGQPQVMAQGLGFPLRPVSEGAGTDIANLLVNAGLDTGALPSRYAFNGTNQYLSIPDFTTLGDPDRFRRVAYEANNDQGYIFDDAAPEPIQELGRVGTNYHDGKLWNVSIYDSSPIQGVTAAVSNGSNYFTLGQTVSLSGDFTIQWNWLRQEKNSAGITYLVAHIPTNTNTIAIDNSLQPTPNRLVIRGDLSFADFAANSLELIEPGKQGIVKITRVGNAITLTVNNTEIQTKTKDIGVIQIDSIVGKSGISYAQNGTIITDFIAVDGANTYWWPMTETDGLAVINQGTTGANYNGTWDSLPNRKYIPLNSRFYSLEDAPASVAPDLISGKMGNIINATQDSWEELSKNPAIWNKPVGEPIFLVHTGQSNGLCWNVAENPPLINYNVFDWSTNGTAIPQDTNEAEWLVADTISTVPKADFTNTLPYVGYREENYGNTAIATADRLQKLTGRDVYLVQVSQAGRFVAEWTTPGGIGEVLEAAVLAAIASPELSAHGITEPDAIIWMQGEADYQMSNADYLTGWNAWKTSTEGVWTTAGVTQFYLYDLVEQWNWSWSASSESIGPKSCVNLPYVADNVTQATWVPSQGLPGQQPTYFGSTEDIHFSGDSANRYGAERFALAIAYTDAGEVNLP